MTDLSADISELLAPSPGSSAPVVGLAAAVLLWSLLIGAVLWLGAARDDDAPPIDRALLVATVKG